MIANPMSYWLTSRPGIAMPAPKMDFQFVQLGTSSIPKLRYGSHINRVSFPEISRSLFFPFNNFFTMKNQPFSNMVHIAICVLLSVVIGLSQGTNDAPINQSLLGGELYYDLEESSTVNIVLVKYYSCQSDQFSDVEKVSIHETEYVKLAKVLDLSLASKNKVMLEDVPDCLTNEEACYYEVVYSGKSYLTMREKGFDVTWGSSYIDGSIANLDNTARQALSLVLHIENPWSEKLNYAPRLKQFPLPLICMDSDFTLDLSGKDEDGDYVLVRPSELFSHEALEVHEYYYDVHQKRSGPNVNFLGRDETFMAERPPFQKLKLADGYSFKNPLGPNQYDFNEKTQVVNLNAMADKFLIGFNIQDFRDKEKISEHPMFLIIQSK